MPICAIIDPSTSSTTECTIDCGCTTTAIWDAGAPNSQCASITSSPLFINVAESIVIFGPICHVGCFSASSAVTRSRLACARPRNGPPDAVSTRRRSSRACAAMQALVDGVVLAVDGQDRDAAAARGVHHQPAGHDQHFLVGQRDGLARLDRREDRFERRGAGGRAQDEIDVGMGRDGNQRIAPGAVLGGQFSSQHLAQLVHRAAGGHGDGLRLVAGDLRRERGSVAACRQRDHLDAIGVRVGHRQRARADRSRRAENRDALLHANSSRT